MSRLVDKILAWLRRWRVLTIVPLGMLALLSLIPKGIEIRTGAPGDVEHFAAYALTALHFACAWLPRITIAAICIGLAAYAGFLELAQHFVPGRTPALSNFLASAAGAYAGAVAGGWMVRHPGAGTTPP